MEDESLFVSSDEEAATDLTTLLKELFNKDKRLQTSPLFIVGESYGGRFAVTIAVSVLKAIQSRELKLRLGGIQFTLLIFQVSTHLILCLYILPIKVYDLVAIR